LSRLSLSRLSLSRLSLSRLSLSRFRQLSSSLSCPSYSFPFLVQDVHCHLSSRPSCLVVLVLVSSQLPSSLSKNSCMAHYLYLILALKLGCPRLSCCRVFCLGSSWNFQLYSSSVPCLVTTVYSSSCSIGFSCWFRNLRRSGRSFPLKIFLHLAMVEYQ
jgi:hypothetical protein